jgi:hypothetical protein
MLRLVACTQTYTNVFKRFSAVEGSIKIPAAVPLLEDTVIIMEFNIVI